MFFVVFGWIGLFEDYSREGLEFSYRVVLVFIVGLRLVIFFLGVLICMFFGGFLG